MSSAAYHMQTGIHRLGAGGELLAKCFRASVRVSPILKGYCDGAVRRTSNEQIIAPYTRMSSLLLEMLPHAITTTIGCISAPSTDGYVPS